MPKNNRVALLAEWAVPALLTLFAAIFLYARLLSGNAYLAFFDDDFFYYLQVARNIAAGHGSTFDGIHSTNGYHPLWMLVNIILVKLFHGRAFFFALLTFMLGCILFTYGALAAGFRRYFAASTASFCAALLAAEFLLIAGGGMEILLTIPLLALLCQFRLTRFQWTPSGCFLYGLLAALVVLSRLDSVLFITVLSLFELSQLPSVAPRARLRVTAAYLAGLLPVLLYLALNLVLFHAALPVSSAAKELRTTHLPTFVPFQVSLVYGYPIQLQLNRPVFLGILLCAAFLLTRGRGRLAPGHLPLVWALLLFPLVQISALSVLSDWPLWDWYFYTFLAAAFAVVLVLGTREERWLRGAPRFAPALIAIAAFLFAGKSAAHALKVARQPHHPVFEIYDGAQDLAAFAVHHPGIYAMGDRSGLVGYSLHQPLVQLEGLMMDKAYLENIRRQRNVLDTLKDYNVRYYVVTNPQPSHGCELVREPIQAGPTSDVMHGVFCQPPIYQFAYGDFHTYVFDLQKP